MKNFSKKLIFTIGTLLLVTSCGYGTLESKEEAIAFLESHSFMDEEASISGKNVSSAIHSSFSMKFENGKAIINDEIMPYTITEMSDGGIHFNGPGYEIEFCGSERYAYGGCIKGYLSGGFNDDKTENEYGPSLQIQGDYFRAYFSYITENGIVEK